MSKAPNAFKSSLMGKESRLVIEPSLILASESFYINHETVLGEKSFNFHNDQAPALALAVLEAAGYTEVDRGECDDLTHSAYAMQYLQLSIQEQERATAEAESQAKLEAEALELRNAWALGNCAQMNEFSYLTEEAQENWLAVARRARELNKEDNNA